MDTDATNDLKRLREENARLKRFLAECESENAALRKYEGLEEPGDTSKRLLFTAR